MDRFLKVKADGDYELVSEIEGFEKPALVTISNNMDLADEYFIVFDGAAREIASINIMATWLSGAASCGHEIYGDSIVAEKLNKNGIKKALLGSLDDKDIKELQLVLEEDRTLAAKAVSEMFLSKGEY